MEEREERQRAVVREIGRAVAAEYKVSRQGMYAIREGISGSVAAEEYWKRVKEGLPEMFPPSEKRHPGLVIAKFAKRKRKVAAV
jgi:hypothetical protein